MPDIGEGIVETGQGNKRERHIRHVEESGTKRGTQAANVVAVKKRAVVA